MTLSPALARCGAPFRRSPIQAAGTHVVHAPPPLHARVHATFHETPFREAPFREAPGNELPKPYSLDPKP
eukprot:52718-Chlamydomonas_euryale.AAC.3